MLFSVGTVSTQCIIGTSDVNPTIPRANSGQYIDLQHPATCRGNITAWHFCYYTESIDANVYTLFFRVWRSRNTNNLDLVHEYQQSSEVGDQSQAGVVICENVTLQVSEYFEVLPGDVVGVYVPFLIPTVSIVANNAVGSQLQFDTRENVEAFTSDRIQTRELIDLQAVEIHLFARVGKNILTSCTITSHCQYA